MTKVKTETGTLQDGVLFGETLHMDFELRLPVMKDNGQALEEAEERYNSVDRFAADYYYRCAVMASTLIRLGNIPQEELTADLLFENLTTDDYDLLLKARDRLKAKRNGGKPASPDSALPSSPSDDTASPKNK
ncbi:hypothetical protein ACVSUC_19745 [Yersinia enterocolitica]|uniref:hypothetical protein n=1 Tax=Yersinia enterocolitica TaxID=630 RepID=UPI0037D6798A|nr:hypothetical protein [Yersinia enterocolitica]